MITRRPAEPDDEVFLYELYAAARAEEMDAWGWGETQRDAFLKLQFTAQTRGYEAAFPRASHHIILLDGRAVGRFLVDRGPDQIRLVDIALLPRYRGQGIASDLIQDLLDEGAQSGRPVRLQVLKTNPATRLYKRLGFATVEESGLHLEMEARSRGSGDRSR